jgi:phosphoribosylformylglycinamidine cyclo-ligase
MLASMGHVPEREMFNTYNMGVGMTVIVSKETADRALEALRAAGCAAYSIGEIVSGGEKVVLC